MIDSISRCLNQCLRNAAIKQTTRLLHVLIIANCVLTINCFGQARTSEERLREFLEQFPDSDLDGNGTLTRQEVREFNHKRKSDQAASKNKNRERPEPTVADYAYGDHEKQRFDLWTVPDAKEPTPLVIHIHGGGFRGGDKKAFNSAVVAQYHNAGIAFASMNYRLSDTGPYPIMMQDCARGLQTIRHRAERWNLDPSRVGCYGSSAGAGISLWLAFHDDLADPDNEDPIARQSTRIMAAATSNGQSTYDLRTFRNWFDVPNLAPHEALIPLYGVEHVEDWQSDRVKQLMRDASPITHLSADDNAPIYMSYSRPNSPVDGDTDPSVWVHHYRLGAKLKEAMDELDKECHLVGRETRKNGLPYRGATSFFMDKLRSK